MALQNRVETATALDAQRDVLRMMLDALIDDLHSPGRDSRARALGRKPASDQVGNSYSGSLRQP